MSDAVQGIRDEVAQLRKDVTKELSELREELKRASSFQVGFQAVSRTLTYVCIIAAAGATVYASLIRKG